MRRTGLFNFLVGSSVSFFILGCGRQGAHEFPSIAPKPAVVKQPEKITFKFTRPTSDPRHYYLIAGGHDSANFAQEIIDQRKYLISKGVAETDIACYYTLPDGESFKADEDQYRALKSDLEKCSPANPKIVLENLQSVADDFVYVYVSSHGNPPIKDILSKLSWTERIQLAFVLSKFPDLNQYMVALDADPVGRPQFFHDKIELLKKAGAQWKKKMQELFFTPTYLKNALNLTGVKDRKTFIAVQACYSGGFVEDFRGEANLAIMSAAQKDRPSFGCDPGGDRTYFGEEFNRVLFATGKLPQEVDWKSLHQEVLAKVTAKEDDYRKQLDPKKQKEFLPSNPQFYSSF